MLDSPTTTRTLETVSVAAKAMQMPELLLLIANHLSLQSLARSLPVCSAWHNLLEPFLWQTFTFPAPRPIYGAPSLKRQPTAAHVRKMSGRIQRFICLQDPAASNYGLILALIPQCRDQLVQLDVYLSVPEVDTLLAQNQGSLRKLRIESNMYQQDKAHLARQVLSERVKGMRLLEELSLNRFHISDKEEGEAFLEVCQRLQVLKLGRVKVDVVIPSQTQGLGQETSGDNKNDSEPFTLPRLRKLSLDRITMDRQQQLALWKACTHLEDLTWVYRTLAPEFEFPIVEICNHLAQPSSLSAVVSLTRLSLKSNSIGDQDFSRLLDLLPNLEAFSANLSRFGPLALATLLGNESKHQDNNSIDRGKATTMARKRRAHQWKELSLANCLCLTGLDFQRILTSCPSLKVFAGGPIYINQLVSHESLLSATISTLDLPSPESKILSEQENIPLQDRPWVCLGLESLDVQLLLCTQQEPRERAVPARDSIDMRIRRAIIYNRLATLTSLKVLSLNTISSFIANPALALIEEEQGTRAFGLDMSLRYEMARLAPLKKLQQLNLTRLESELRMEDQDFWWMERTFPELVAVLGPFEKMQSNLSSLRFHVGLL